MMRLAMLFLFCALLAATLGLTGVVGDLAWVAKAAFLGLLVLFIVFAAASAWLTP